MTMLLTGATGFVGRQVHKALVARDVPVRVVIRAGTDARLAAPAERIVTTPDLFAERVAWWRTAATGVHTVIHAAWTAEPGSYLHSPRNEACVAGTTELACGAIEAGVRRFVGIGTCLEYEATGRPLSIQTPLRPASGYARAKAATFTALSQLLPGHGVEFAWCRLFYLYGEGADDRRLVAYLHARLAAREPAMLTKGDQVRDFLDVREAGEMVAEIAFGRAQGPINICSGIPTTVRALAERIADEYGRRDLLHFGARADEPSDPPYVVGIPSLRRR